MFLNSSKSWRFAFWHLGKRKTLVLGQYPEISLKRARELLAEARTHVAEGIVCYFVS
ncbi:MAG: Arm DNA-binding domain-containing protein [Myxococcales bacterium]|nr:Arm DNA-binding domain-containing protein [Myxococcales bacterium]